MAENLSNYQYIHGCYVPISKNHDAVVANIKNVDTNESILYIKRDPEVKVWVTKPQFRNHTEKKEYANLNEVDEIKTKYCEIGQALFQALEGRKFFGQTTYFNQRKLMSSPYVYGADIDIKVRIKHAFRKMCSRMPSKINVGVLDIESSVLGNNEIILITFINGNGDAYCSIFKPFFKPGQGIQNVIDYYEKRVRDKFYGALEPKILDILKNNPIKTHYHESDSELEMITWLFEQMHVCKPDFCVIWNMGYDIPRIIERLQFLGKNPADVMCHPDVPKDLRMFKWTKDNKNTKQAAHITDKWDWLDLPGYTQFLDAMCLYGRLRKAKGRDISYKLDYIGAKELGTGKLDFGQNRTHAEMQMNDFVGYTVYNEVDCIILYLMDHKNRDVNNLLHLIGVSNLEDFNKQTVQLKNTTYEWLEPLGKVPASIGESTGKDWDCFITNKGGLVLDTTNAEGTGIAILKETDRPTSLQKWVSDIDAKLVKQDIGFFLQETVSRTNFSN